MSIFRKAGSRFYQFEFQLKGFIFSGSTKCADEREAQEFEAGKRLEAQAIVATFERERRGPMTLQVACDRWWDEHGQHLATISERQALNRICEILGGRTSLHAISDASVTELVQQRRKDTRRDSTDKDGKAIYRPVAPTTVNRTIDLLRRVMRRARDNWNVAIVREPVWKNHRLKEIRRKVRELRPSEEQALDQVESFDHAELRRFAIVTGLRLQNLFLTWPQVNFELAQIEIITKGGVPRVLPMTPEIYAMLWRRRGHHPQYVWTAVCVKRWRNPHDADDVRIVGRRYPITASGYQSHKDRTWSAAGVTARIHDLRHTAGMRTLRQTGNLRLVQKLLGHSDVSTTAKFYTDATIEDLRAGMVAASTPAPAAADIEAPKLLEKKGNEHG